MATEKENEELTKKVFEMEEKIAKLTNQMETWKSNSSGEKAKLKINAKEQNAQLKKRVFEMEEKIAKLTNQFEEMETWKTEMEIETRKINISGEKEKLKINAKEQNAQLKMRVFEMEEKIAKLTNQFKEMETWKTEMEIETRKINSSGDNFLDNELRLVLIGITGSGKSTSGNSILGKKSFLSKVGATSVTTSVSFKQVKRFGFDLLLIDTPELKVTELSDGEVTREIIQCFAISAPGPHAFIMVIRITRFTPEEQQTIKFFKDTFGEKFTHYLFLLFTGIDDLEEEEMTLDDYLSQATGELKQLIEECGGRYAGINNREKDDLVKERQVKYLIDKITQNIQSNGGKHFTTQMMEAAEEEVRKREQQESEEKRLKEKKKIEKEMEEKLRKREKEMKAEMEAKMDAKEKMLKEERDKQEIEIMKKQLDKGLKLVDDKFEQLARNQDRTEAETNPSLITLVGNGLRGVPRGTHALGKWFFE